MKRSVRGEEETFVRMSSVAYAEVSTSAGSVIEAIGETGLAATGSTKEPSDVAWSLTTA